MKPEFILNENLRFVPKDAAALRQYIEELKVKQIAHVFDPLGQVNLLGEIGVYLRTLDLFDEAEDSLLKALILVDVHKLGRYKELQNKIRLAHVYQEKKDFKKSNKLFAEILEACRSNDDVVGLLHFALQHQGKNFFDQAQYENALKCFEEALEIRLSNSAPADQLESTQNAIKRVTEILKSMSQR